MSGDSQIDGESREAILFAAENQIISAVGLLMHHYDIAQTVQILVQMVEEQVRMRAMTSLISAPPPTSSRH